MPASAEYHEVQIVDIKVNERQRKKISGIDTLARSIKIVGLLNPIIVTRGLVLVAGERRLKACQKLEQETIHVHYYDELNSHELKIVELEENVRRSDLTWQEEALAIVNYHDTRCEDDNDWEIEDTMQSLIIGEAPLHKQISVGRVLIESPQTIKGAESTTAAYNMIRRGWHRAAAEELSDISLGMTDEEPAEIEEDEPKETVKKTRVRASEKDILHESFIDFASTYKGPKFNFLHCDFPYGISHERSKMGGARTFDQMYDDSPDVYWNLCKCLCDNIDRILLPSAHIMFWLSMSNYSQTKRFFFDHAPSLEIWPFPLIWHKSDGKGILSDPERLPRNTYEVALFITRGDRRVVSPVYASYSAPTGKATSTHISQKPESVLRHFFRLFVDNLSVVLDPTCGSGTALVAAEALGAKRVTGLDINKTFVEDSRRALDKYRTIEAAREIAL